jgi:hypothetical protein
MAPQAPQFMRSPVSSAQVRVVPPSASLVRHSVVPAAHMNAQVPLAQTSLGPHTRPQPPQWLRSVASRTQARPASPTAQRVSSPTQLGTQAPLSQRSRPAAQARPQPPQLSLSLRVLTHRSLQRAWSGLQAAGTSRTPLSTGGTSARVPPTTVTPSHAARATIARSKRSLRIPTSHRRLRAASTAWGWVVRGRAARTAGCRRRPPRRCASRTCCAATGSAHMATSQRGSRR